MGGASHEERRLALENRFSVGGGPDRPVEAAKGSTVEGIAIKGIMQWKKSAYIHIGDMVDSRLVCPRPGISSLRVVAGLQRLLSIPENSELVFSY